MLNGCPGSSGIKGTPEIKLKTCPTCGGEIELFSGDACGVCSTCGFTAYQETQSCILWCAKARECLGDELYEVTIKNINAAKAAESERKNG
ncbi:hypothetical protein FACS1894208_04870 [Clostridia bacterium]|nr:hypothetical protein FACS1894208_04870 [Clostridia bacterium]